MKRILDLIHTLGSSDLTANEIFEQQNKIKLEIETEHAFFNIKHSDSLHLTHMLNSVVKNKLNAREQFYKQEKIAFQKDFSIKEQFVQNLFKAGLNTDYLVSPFCNTGVKDACTASESYAFPRHLDNYKLISTADGVVPVLHAVPQENELVAHDWVTFSFCISTLEKSLYHLRADSEDALTRAIEDHLDHFLFETFGFGLDKKREKGMHFYKYAYDLQDNLGIVLYGHNNKRVSVQINGTGCALARKGWQKPLHDFLVKSISPKLNRVDLAFDDFDGDFVTVDLCDEWDDEGLFTSHVRQPDVTKFGNWKRPNGAGRTLNIGSRSSNKSFRCYERGKKEGCSLSLWTRAELELHSNDCYIPLDILLSPTQYYSGAYPALEILCKKLKNYSAPERIKVVKKQAELNFKKAIEVTKHQFGKYIRQFRKVLDDSELLDLLVSDKDAVPKRLKFSHSAVMQSIRINQPTYCTDLNCEHDLFTGVSGVFQPNYGVSHGI